MDARELCVDGLLDVREACQWLGLGRARLYQMMSAGEVPFVLLGRRRLIPRRALVELAAANLRGNLRAVGE